VLVSGARGEVTADPQLYRYPLRASASDSSLTAFLDRIRRVLQDDLQTSAEVQHLTADGAFLFMTVPTRRPELVGTNEKTIEWRNVSYLVEVPRKTDDTRGFAFTVKGLIRYKRKLEDTVRAETNDEVYGTALQPLLKRLESARPVR
jgi:hypothetical protein